MTCTTAGCRFATRDWRSRRIRLLDLGQPGLGIVQLGLTAIRGDIDFANCFQNCMLAIRLPDEAVDLRRQELTQYCSVSQESYLTDLLGTRAVFAQLLALACPAAP